MTDSEIDALTESMTRSICSKVTLEPRGVDRYLIHTGFTFQDGDELHIVLRRRDGRWILTDDGHTLMWLSYEDFRLTETRRALLDVTMSSNSVSLEDGRISIDCTDRDMGQCLMSMIQAILQTADLLYLNRYSARSTYADDIKQFMRDSLGDRCEFDKRIRRGDEEYVVDVYVEAPTPLYVFSVSNRDRCNEALITILALSVEAEMDFTSLIFVDHTADIKRNTLVKLINRSDKMFYDTPSEDELRRFLGRTGVLPA